MKGLKTQENAKFQKFWDIVQSKAANEGNIFFMDCGEGHVLETDDIECEDIRGWLIPKSRADEFNAEWENDSVSDKWVDNISWAEWKQSNNSITVEFKTY